MSRFCLGLFVWYALGTIAAQGGLPSLIPETELYYHIGGGFCSAFSACSGTARGCTDSSVCCLDVRAMQRLSPCVYALEGTLRVHGMDYSLELLDYIFFQGGIRYRMIASANGQSVCLVGTCVNGDFEGSLYQDGTACCVVHIPARAAGEAEKVLWRLAKNTR